MAESPYFFSVPSLIMLVHQLDIPAGAIRTSRKVTVDGGLEVFILTFRFVDEEAMLAGLEAVIKQAAERGCTLGADAGAAADDMPAMLLVSKSPRVEVLDTDEVKDRDKNFQSEAKIITDSDTNFLKIFARYAGLRVVHCIGGIIIQPPFPDEPGTIYFFSQARPPGLLEMDLHISKLFGMELWREGETRVVNSPTRGRGRVVEHDGQSVFQVLGSNYYQLCLTRSILHDPLIRSLIFIKSLGRLYQDLLENYGRAPEAVVDATEEEFTEFLEGQAASGLRELREDLHKAEADIHLLEAGLTKKLRDRQQAIVRIKALTDSDFVRELQERMPLEYETLKQLEGVAAISIVDDAIHLESEPVVLEHDGARYDLGRFTVRLDPCGEVEVWSEAPRHPQGHHHPHISKLSLACYGNVTVAIAKLMSAYRFTDAARLVLRWLKTYSPETTLNPINEWPVLAQKEETHARNDAEPVATAQPV